MEDEDREEIEAKKNWERSGGRLSTTESTRWFVVAEQKGGHRDILHTRSQNNSTPTAMDDLGHPTSFSDTEDDDDIEMVGLEEVAMTPQKKFAHVGDNDSESSDDEDDDASRGLLVSGSQRGPGHAHTRSLSLSRGIDIWQQVKNIVIEVSGFRRSRAKRSSHSIDRTYPLVHDGGHNVHRGVDGEGPCERSSQTWTASQWQLNTLD